LGEFEHLMRLTIWTLVALGLIFTAFVGLMLRRK
jgi:hypothetical protein